MKHSKKIMFVLTAFIVSLFAGIASANLAESNIVGLAIFAISFAPAILSLIKPELTLFKAAFDLIIPSQLTWHGKEVMEMAQTIYEDVYQNPDLAMTNLIVEDIVALEQIAYLGILSKVTKKSTGCESTPTNKNVPLSEQFWEPTSTEFWLEECVTNLEQTFWVWGLNKGIKKYDLTGTDFADFIMERLSTALLEDTMRIAWFNDKDAAHSDDSPAGVLTPASVNPADPTDVTDYNIIDGIWKRLFAIGVATPNRVVTIPNNANAVGNQEFTEADIANGVITNIFRKVKKQADTRLTDTEKAGLQFYVTRSVYEQYEDELGAFRNIEASWLMLQNGVKTLTYKGIPLVKMSFWDRTLSADFQDTTGKIYLPHRILLTVKENIPIGVDSKSALTEVENWYRRSTKTYNWRGGYKIDTKVMKDYMVQMAY